MEKPFLSVVIPCYNEEKNLKRGVLDNVERYLERQKYPNEVIISDDGSTDHSLDFIKKYIKTHRRFRLLENKHAGKPFAVRSGLKTARGDIVLFADMDQSTPLRELEKLLPLFSKGSEVVIGSRGFSRKGFSLFRKIASNVFRLARRLFLLSQITDTQCGFKAFKREVALKIFSKLAIFKNAKETRGWRVSAYDVELLYVAQKLGYGIKEVEVNWQDRDISIGKQRNFLKESKEMFLEILRVKLNEWRGIYD